MFRDMRIAMDSASSLIQKMEGKYAHRKAK